MLLLLGLLLATVVDSSDPARSEECSWEEAEKARGASEGATQAMSAVVLGGTGAVGEDFCLCAPTQQQLRHSRCMHRC